MEQSLETDNQVFHALSQEYSIKKAVGEVYCASNLSLIDVSLKARGPREDHLFATSKFLRQNVPRGLSFLEEDTKGITICRRGLQKFFDMRDEYLEILDGITDIRGARLSKDEEKLFHVIFDEVEASLANGKKVTVYKTEKANGENAQVAYNAKYDAWVIASKNVSLLMRNAEDIKVYANAANKSRYAFAVLIAEAWLDILKKNVQDIDALKKELTGKTLVGEYCGHPKHQHLVEYKEITIFFFALVDIHGNRTCYPLSVAKEFLNKHNLPMVKITPRRVCENTKELVEILRELAKEVAQNTIEEDAEGSVVYFEVANDSGPEVLSLCKVKTLEYRVYRKLREKLKSMISRGKTVSEQMSAYRKEVAQLCYRYQLPSPVDYYFSIAQLAFEFVDSRRDIAKKLGLSNRYLDFLKVIKSCKAKGIKPKAEHFQKLIDESNDLSDDSDIGDEGPVEEKKPAKKKGRRSSDEDEIDDEDDRENNVNKGKKSRKSTEEEEERKIESGKGASSLIGRVVIITPPLYFDHGVLQKLNGEADEFEEDWEEEKEIKGKNIVLLHKFPEIVKEDAVKANTFFIVTGFKESKNSTLKKLDSLAKYGIGDMKFNSAELEYINNEDRAQKLEALWAGQKQFIEHLGKTLPDNYSEAQLTKADKILEEVSAAFTKLARRNNVSTQQAPGERKGSKSKKGKKQILVFVSTGLPGMGKTRHIALLRKKFEDREIPVTVISSDKVRKELMDKARKKDPSMNHQQAFDKSSKDAKPKFFEYVENALEKTNTLGYDTHVVILDKNHPPNIIQDTIEFFHKGKFKAKYDIKVIVVKPICGEGFRTKDGVYPFSLSFFTKCMQRALGRAEHETLVGEETKIATVLFGFFSSHKNFKASNSGFMAMGADLVVELPFTQEDEAIESQLKEKLGGLVVAVLRSLRGFEAGKEEMSDFLKEIKALQIELKDPDENEVQEKTTRALEKCLELFENTA